MAEKIKTHETSKTTEDELKAKSELSIDEFLQKIELSKYIDIFKEEEVTMDILKTFNEDDLKNIGIDKYGPRKQILNSIASLEHQGQKDLEAIHSPLSFDSIDVQPSAPPMPEEQSDALPLNPPSYEEAIGADNAVELRQKEVVKQQREAQERQRRQEEEQRSERLLEEQKKAQERKRLRDPHYAAIVKTKFTDFGYVRRNKVEELLCIFADLLQIPVTSIRLSDEEKDGICDIREFLLTISTSSDKEKELIISTLNEASFLEKLNDKCKKNDIFSLPTNEFKRFNNPVEDEIKGKIVVSWRFRDGKEGTIDKGVPTKKGNKMWTKKDDILSYFGDTLSSYPEYLAGSHQYQLPWGNYGSRLQITLQVKTNCDVYLCCRDGIAWRSDRLQRIGFVKKYEKVEYSNGKMMIHHKNCLGKETVVLPEINADSYAYVTIFVK